MLLATEELELLLTAGLLATGVLLEGCSGAWLETAGGVLDTGAEELLSDSLFTSGAELSSSRWAELSGSLSCTWLMLASVSRTELLSSLSLLHPVAVTDSIIAAASRRDMSLVFIAGQSFRESYLNTRSWYSFQHSVILSSSYSTRTVF